MLPKLANMSYYEYDSEYVDEDYSDSGSDYYDQDRCDTKYPKLSFEMDLVLGCDINEDTFDDFDYKKLCKTKSEFTVVICKLNNIKNDVNEKLSILTLSFDEINENLKEKNSDLETLCNTMETLVRKFYNVKNHVDTSPVKASTITLIDMCKGDCRKTQNEINDLLVKSKEHNKKVASLESKIDNLDNLILYVTELKNKKITPPKPKTRKKTNKKSKKGKKLNFGMRNTMFSQDEDDMIEN